MVKINWKARLHNKYFWASIISAIFLLIGSVPELKGVLPEWFCESFFTGFLNLLVMFGIIVDPTTNGFEDSSRAMTYYNKDK